MPSPSPTPHNINPFKIGCDPEFLILEKETNQFQAVINTNQVGMDGSGVPVELRPEPTYTAFELLNNLRRLLTDAANLGQFRTGKYLWRAGALVSVKNSSGSSFNQPIGGHIHIDRPVKCGNIGEEGHKVIKACDQVIKILEALNIHPKEESRMRRECSAYGKFSTFYDDHISSEGHHRIEYRTPCSWLSSPNVAFITLTLIKLAATAPSIAIEMLQVTDNNQSNWKNLRRFVKQFVHLDSDAEQVYKKLTKTKREKENLKVPANSDMKAQWGVVHVSDQNNQTIHTSNSGVQSLESSIGD